MNLEIRPLSAKYAHPQGWNLTGHWGLYESGRLIATAPTKAELEALLPPQQLQEAA